jgi:hypothetical protein
MDQRPTTSEVQPAAKKDRWASFRGLRWWQLVLVFLPVGLLGVGGALGGLIGGVGLVSNLTLARRQFGTGLKVLAMIGVVVASYALYFVIVAIIFSATH